jgi:hypothetical protein
MRLVKASEMQEMDRFAIERNRNRRHRPHGECRARGATRVFVEHFEPPPNSRVLFLCGRGTTAATVT